MEANISDELTTSLDNILNNVGITWNNQVKVFAKIKSKIDDAISIMGDLTRSPID